jgi:hypothetical protein
MMRMRFSISSNHRIWQGANLLPKRLVGHGDHLGQKQIAISGNAALALFETKPKNPRIFYKPCCGWYDYRRWISRFIDEI